MKTVALLLTAFVTVGFAAVRSAQSSRSGPWVTEQATLPDGAAPTPRDIAIVKGIAYRSDITMRDGTIDFDLGAPTPAFAGVAFRMASTSDYEIVYFNPTADRSRWAGIQYQPVYQGETTWQLYYNEGYRAALPSSIPTSPHVRIVVTGTRADVYVGGTTTPVLRVRELKRDAAPGHVGVWVNGPVKAAPVSFTNLTIDDHAPAPLPAVAQPAPRAGQLTRWHVSQRFDSPGEVHAPAALPASLDLTRTRIVTADEMGVISLTKALGNPAGPQAVNVFGGAGWGLAYASVTLDSPTSRRVSLALTYTDGIGVYLNGTRLFAGDNSYDARYEGSFGALGGETDTVDLPLRAGRNTLVLCITDKAFGWGFKALLRDAGTIRVE